MLCVFSFGGTSNVNLKNFARSYFCFLIIGIILMLIVFVLLTAMGLLDGGLDSFVASNSQVVS